jgi:hypothetical protein
MGWEVQGHLLGDATRDQLSGLLSAPFMKRASAEVDFGPEDPGGVIVAYGSVADTNMFSLPLAVFSFEPSADHPLLDVVAANLSAYAISIDEGVGFDFAVVAPQGTWGVYSLSCLYTTP